MCGGLLSLSDIRRSIEHIGEYLLSFAAKNNAFVLFLTMLWFPDEPIRAFVEISRTSATAERWVCLPVEFTAY